VPVVHASRTTLVIPAYKLDVENVHLNKERTYREQDHLLLFPGYPPPIENFPVLTLDPRSPERWYWHHRDILKLCAGCARCNESVVVVSNHARISLIHVKLGASPDLNLDHLARTAGHNEISNFGESFVSLSTHDDADYRLTRASNDSCIEDALHRYGPWDLKIVSIPTGIKPTTGNLQNAFEDSLALCRHVTMPVIPPSAAHDIPRK
jgi:hypothetical protein